MNRKHALPKPEKTLRSRLTNLVVIAIVGAVCIVTASSVLREVWQYNHDKHEELTKLAHVLASSVNVPIAAGNKQATLNSIEKGLALIPSIDHVSITNADNSIFIDTSVRDVKERVIAPPSGPSPQLLVQHLASFATQTTRASVIIPYSDGNGSAKTLTLYATNQSLISRISVLVYDALVAAVFAGGIGILIALRLQRSITDPILDLVSVMRRVRETGDFSVRAKREEDDETGQLVDTLNNMLDQLQERDAKLQAHQRDLQKVVQNNFKQQKSPLKQLTWPSQNSSPR